MKSPLGYLMLSKLFLLNLVVLLDSCAGYRAMLILALRDF